ETWYCLRSINGSNLTIDWDPNSSIGSAGVSMGYAGTSEIVTLYKRETIKLTFGAANYCQFTVAGTNSSTLLTFSGGWDRTSMSTQNLETWYDPLMAIPSLSVYFVNAAFVDLLKMAVVRAYTGVNLNANNCYLTNFLAANHCQQIGFNINGSNCTIG